MAFLTEAANRGSVVIGPYDIDNSLKVEADNSEYIYRTPSSAGNRKTWTLSFWIKRTELAEHFSGTMRIFEAWDGSTGTSGLFTASDEFILDLNAGSNYFTSNAKFRDPSAWYHFVIRVDTTQGTASERARVYVNGLELTGSWNSNIGQNTDLTWNQDVAHNFARFHNNDSFVSGYYADIINVDGQSLAPTSFGEFDEDSGIWKPKNANGSGTNGFKLEFKNSGNLGADTSGNSNNWTLNAIAAIDQATDTPTNNFCTINPLFDNNFAIWSLTEGGTRGPNTGENNASVGTFAVDSGKWYWEGVSTSFSGTNYWKWGITRVDVAQGNSADPSTDANSAWYTGDNAFYTQTSTTASSVSYNTGFTGYTAGDIWSVSLNCDVSPYQMTFRINNAVPGTTSNNTNRSVGTYASADAVLPFFMLANSSSDNTYHNFGNPFLAALSGGNSDGNGYGDFKYAPPSGYYALCSKNLAEYG